MDVRFLDPGMAVCLLAVPLAAFAAYLHARAKQAFRREAGYGRGITGVSRLSPGRRDLAVITGAATVSAAMALAVMQPQIYMERLEPEYARQDLVLILDRSVSMQARDVAPSRFTRAVQEIRQFLVEKPDEIDRVSLIGFAETSVTLSYLTRDLDSLFFFLDWILDDREVYYGTDITGALEAARELADRDTEGTGKIFLLLSDGDDRRGSLRELLGVLQEQGVRVHTVGIGSEYEVPIPDPRPGAVDYLQDEEGNPLTTRLDETTLRLVASMTGGSFFRSTTGSELPGFLQRIVSGEQRQVGWRSTVEYFDVHLPLLAFSAFTGFFLLLKA